MKKVKLPAKNKGQVLIMALVAMFVFFILAVVVIETGNLIYQKVHMQNIADSGAMEGGLWYARSLNILSLSNKILLCSGVVAGVLTLLQIPEAEKIPEVIQKLQDVFAGTGDFEKWKIKPAPFMDMIMVLRNGYNNGVFSMPLFNVDDFSENGFNPAFNVYRTYMSDVGQVEKLYYFNSKCDGQNYYFKENEVEYNDKLHTFRLKNCKVVPPCPECTYTLYKKPIIKRKTKSDKLVPLAIEESGNHSVLVVSIKTNLKQVLNSGFLNDKDGNPIMPSSLISAAMTIIDGGEMSIWDINGAGYTPKLRHIILPKLQQIGILKELKNYIKYVDMFTGQVSNNILLH